MPFAPVTLSPGQERLRWEVREFLARELPRGSYRPGLAMNADASPESSRQLAGRGWVGMTIPERHGGHGLGPVERFIVVEELAGACAAVASLTIEYAHQRQQFGRPIARFQAVGSRLVQLASEAELAVLSATVAAIQFTARDLDGAFEVAAARVSASRAAGQVGRKPTRCTAPSA